MNVYRIIRRMINFKKVIQISTKLIYNILSLYIFSSFLCSFYVCVSSTDINNNTSKNPLKSLNLTI